MITVKAFDKNLQCRGFQYKVGETYEIPKEKVDMCKWGFHASAHCDISETITDYPKVTENRYCLVDLEIYIETIADIGVSSKITLLKELTFEECIEYDKTGEWCYEYAKNINELNKIKLLEKAVIEKDKTVEWIYRFAVNVKNANIKKLEKAVIERDDTGKWIYYFAWDVKNANIKKLEKAIIKKDKTGEWIYNFALNIKNADIKKLEEAITQLEGDKSWHWRNAFLHHIHKKN